MGRSSYEDVLTDELLQLSYKLDMGLVPRSHYPIIEARIKQLVEQREKIREIFNEARSSTEPDSD